MSWRRTLDANGNPILRNTETGEERPVERTVPESVAPPPGAGQNAPGNLMADPTPSPVRTQQTASLTGPAPTGLRLNDWNVLPNGRTVWVDAQGQQHAERPYVPGGLVNPPDPNLSGFGNFFNQYFNPVPALRNVGVGVENFVSNVDNWARVPQGQLAALPQAQAAAPAEPEPLDLTFPQSTPGGEEYAQEIEGIIASLGDNARGPEFPPFPTQTADPGLQALVERASARDARVQELVSERLARLESRNPEARNRWARVGEWLSAWAASGDAAAGGAIMSQMLARDREMAQELEDEALRWEMFGLDSGDALAAAQASLLSGQHAAQMATLIGQHRQDVQSATLGFESGQNAQQLQATLAASLAQALLEDRARAEERYGGVLERLLPGRYGQEAGVALARNAGAGEDVAAVFGEELARDQRLAQIAARLSGAYARRGDARRLAREARRIDPSLTDEDIQRLIVMLSAQPAQ